MVLNENFIGKSITVKCPATIANLVCGFDILGLALKEPYDLLKLTLTKEKVITIKHHDMFQLPETTEQNVAGVSLQAMLADLEIPYGFNVEITKAIMPGSGLGSSAASSAGAVCAANILLGSPFTKMDLVKFAMHGEKLASGVKHADNIAPCIYGGVTLIRSAFPLDIVPLSFPEMFVTAVHPQIEVRTSDAREILRKDLLLKDAIKQWGNIAGLVAGLLQKDFDLISRSLSDGIIEPVRSILIPEFQNIKSQCLAAGALGGGISGSGPSIFMLSEEKHTASKLEEIISNIYTRINLPFKVYVTGINTNGVEIIEQN